MSNHLVQTLAVIILPMTIPFFRGQYAKLQRYRTVQARPYTNKESRRIKLILIMAIFYAVLIGRNILANESNIYKLTGSRLIVPLDVLNKRLDKLGQSRPDFLWHALESREVVLQYQRLGEDSLRHCIWCTLEVPASYLYYATGRIILPYLGHLALLSFVTDTRMMVVFSTAIFFAIELYLRSGGLDEYNLQSKGVGDIWFVDSYLHIVRQCFFLWCLAIIRIIMAISARYPSTQVDLNIIRSELIETIEKVRTSNSMQRTVVDDGALRLHMNEFWSRNEEQTSKLDREEAIVLARRNAQGRIPDLAQQKAAAADNIQKAIARITLA